MSIARSRSSVARGVRRVLICLLNQEASNTTECMNIGCSSTRLGHISRLDRMSWQEQAGCSFQNHDKFFSKKNIDTNGHWTVIVKDGNSITAYTTQCIKKEHI